MLKTSLLFFATAIAEILGCFLPYLWLRKGGSIWLLLPSAVCLTIFVWLLTLHPAASGRVYAAYGGIFIVLSLFWAWWVDKKMPDTYDWIGGLACLIGVAVMLWPRS